MEDYIKTRSDISVVLIFFIMLTFMGLFAGGFIVKDYAQARESTAWPIYEGIILSQREDENKLRYVYSVDGRSYEGERVRFFSARLTARGKTSTLPGETINVYVSPQDHGVSVIKPGGVGLLFVIGSICCGLCIFFGAGGLVRTLALGVTDMQPVDG